MKKVAMTLAGKRLLGASAISAIVATNAAARGGKRHARHRLAHPATFLHKLATLPTILAHAGAEVEFRVNARI
jgi:hypothetical protein